MANGNGKITLSFTPAQYRRLLNMVYLGNMVMGAADNYKEDAYNEVESVVFSKGKARGREKYAEYIEEYGGFLPTKDFEDCGILKVLENYDDEAFWSELVRRLALIDVSKFADVKNPDIMYSAIIQRTEQYEDFFEENDLTKIKVEGMPPMDESIETFRSMLVGELEADDDLFDEDDGEE